MPIGNTKRLGSDFLNDLKMPVSALHTDENGLNARAQNVLDRQRENLAQVQAREKNSDQKLLYSGDKISSKAEDLVTYDGNQYTGNNKRLHATGNENDEETGLYITGGQVAVE